MCAGADPACAHRAPGVRRARSEDGRVRLGDRSLRASRASTTTRRVTGGVARRRVRRAAVAVLRRAAPEGRWLSARCGFGDRTRRPGSRRDPARRRPRRRAARRRSAIASSSTPTCAHALAALLGARRRAPRRDRAHGRATPTSTSRSRARRLRLDAAARPARFRRARERAASAGWATSDFTAFQLAALARAGMVTFAGPMARYDFGADGAVARSRSSIASACSTTTRGRSNARSTAADVRRERHAVGRQPRAWSRTWSARRTCPTSTAASCSSRTSASIPYRIERMLYQLHPRRHSGAPARGAARRLHRIPLNANDDGYDLAAAIAHMRARVRDADLHRPAVRPRAATS